MEREFVETRIFNADWNALGQTDDQLSALQRFLARYPAARAAGFVSSTGTTKEAA